MQTKCGIDLPDKNDKYYGYEDAIAKLYKTITQICDVLDRQQEEIDDMRKVIEIERRHRVSIEGRCGSRGAR